MWSYPVIQDGLIYTVDLRNGLYILKYNGPHEQEVDDITFLEGNSNQGDALCFEPVAGAVAANCSYSTTGGAGATVPATLSLTLGPAASFGRSRRAWPRTTRRTRRRTSSRPPATRC